MLKINNGLIKIYTNEKSNRFFGKSRVFHEKQKYVLNTLDDLFNIDTDKLGKCNFGNCCASNNTETLVSFDVDNKRYVRVFETRYPSYLGNWIEGMGYIEKDEDVLKYIKDTMMES